MRSLGRTSRLILTVLARSPAHGYGVISWARDVSGGTERLAVGSVYGSLDKLEANGLIERDREAVENGRRRQYYRITDDGRTRLAEAIDTLSTEVEEAKAALALPPGLRGELP